MSLVAELGTCRPRSWHSPGRQAGQPAWPTDIGRLCSLQAWCCHSAEAWGPPVSGGCPGLSTSPPCCLCKGLVWPPSLATNRDGLSQSQMEHPNLRAAVGMRECDLPSTNKQTLLPGESAQRVGERASLGGWRTVGGHGLGQGLPLVVPAQPLLQGRVHLPTL